MKTDSLIYFVSIAYTGSISKTAEAYYISPQAISEHIKKLEQEFNITLLQKTQTGVKLTDQGKKFLEYANSFLSIYYDAQIKLNFSHNTQHNSGILSLAAHPHLSYTDFSKFIVHFHSKHPNIQLSFKEMFNDAIITSLHQHQADIGLFFSVHEQSDIIDNSLQIYQIYENNFYLCYAKNHPLAHLEHFITQADVLSHTLASFPSSDIKTPKELNCFQSTNMYFLLNMISEGILVGLLPETEAKHFFKKNSNIILTPMKPPYFDEIKSSISAGILGDNIPSPLVDIFIQELKQFYC